VSKSIRFAGEKRFQDLVPRQKALFNLRGELAIGGHFLWLLHF
jgi:hypothetical protein